MCYLRSPRAETSVDAIAHFGQISWKHVGICTRTNQEIDGQVHIMVDVDLILSVASLQCGLPRRDLTCHKSYVQLALVTAIMLPNQLHSSQNGPSKPQYRQAWYR